MIVDLDKLFEEYIQVELMPLVNKLKPEDLESKVPDMYMSWQDKACDKLGGVSPREYVDNLDTQGQLINVVKQCISEGIDVNDMYLSALAQEKYATELVLLAKEHSSYAISLLSAVAESGTDTVTESLVDMLDSDVDSDIKDVCCEILSQDKSEVVDIILPRIDESRDSFPLFIDILSHYPGNKNVYQLLKEGFLSGKDISLYATYLGQYLDPSAINVLVDYAKTHTMEYYEFLDIRSAVERLGGEMPKFDYDVLRKSEN